MIYREISLIIHDILWLPVTSGNFRFYTYVTSGFTPMSLPFLHLRHFRFYTYITFLHLRHFRFDNYVTSGFTTTSLFYTYIQTHDLSKLSFFLHLFSLLEKSDVTIWFYTKFWSIQKKYQKRIIRHSFAKTFSKTAPKIQSFKTPFFSIIERFQRFPKNFLKTKFFEMCIMCRSNLASYIPPSGPLGISLPSFDIRGFHLLESEIL